MRENPVLGAGTIRTRHNFAVLDLESAKDVLWRYGSLRRRRALVNEVYPSIPEPPRLGLQPRLARRMTGDDFMQEVHEHTVSGEQLRCDSLHRSKWLGKYAD